MKYTVELWAPPKVVTGFRAYVQVEAADEKEAKRKALERAPDLEWEEADYAGDVMDLNEIGTPEVVGVEESDVEEQE